jgi:hypothetical protein
MLMIMFSRFMPGGSYGRLTLRGHDLSAKGLELRVAPGQREGHFLAADRHLFLQRVIRPAFRHQDAAVVGVAGKAHAHQVPHLAFRPDRALVDAGQTGRFRLAVFVERADDHQMLFARVGAQLVDGVKAAVADQQLRAIDRGDVDDRFIAQAWVILGEFSQGDQLFRFHIDDLLPVMQPGSDDGVAKTFDQAVGVFAFAGGQRRHSRNPQWVEAGQAFRMREHVEKR